MIGEESFIVFIIYGLAFSLLVSASRVIRRKDTVILILAATVVWGIFGSAEGAAEMVRFLTLSALTTLGVLLGNWFSRDSSAGTRAVAGTVLPAVLCGIAGLLMYGFGGYLGPGVALVGRRLIFGFSWGFGLGIAVGLGVFIGSEVVAWMTSRVR
jgi:hypothetical protein